MAEVKTEEKRNVQALMPQRRALAEHAIRHHVVTVEDASHPEDFEKPEFWSLVANQLQIGDHIEVRDDAMTFWAEYLVTACDATWAKTQCLRKVKLDAEVGKEISSEFKVEYKGPHKKHCVIRVSDKSIVKEGCQTAAEGRGWLVEYERTINKKAA